MSNFNLHQFVPESHGSRDTTYTSIPVKMATRGNRTSVFQCNCSTGDTVVLQARISDDLNWVDVLTTGEDTLTEVVTAPQYRVLVSNTTGTDVVAKIHV